VAARGRRFGRLDALCAGGIAAGVVLSYIMLALTPSLLAHHGEVLEALAGTSAAIVAGGALAHAGIDSLLVVVLAPLCGIAIYDVFSFWAGRLWGARAIELYTRRNPRLTRWIGRVEAWVRRRGVWVVISAYFLPVPNYVLYLVCGVSDMSWSTFLLGDIAGTLLWAGLLVGLGWAIGHPAVSTVNAIGDYSLVITVALVVAIAAFALARRGRRGGGPDPSERPTVDPGAANG
jgi:membrane protein DedA with SNARE-associated domain